MPKTTSTPRASSWSVRTRAPVEGSALFRAVCLAGGCARGLRARPAPEPVPILFEDLRAPATGAGYKTITEERHARFVTERTAVTLPHSMSRTTFPLRTPAP